MLISSPFSQIIWQQPDGSTSNDSILLSSLPGTHALTIFRDNGCSLTKTVLVPADTSLPIVFLESGFLGCDSTQITVISTDTIVGYDWTGPLGFTSQSAAPFVHNGGFYLLEATGLNGCSKTTPHFVDTSTVLPQTMVMQELLDCLDSMAVLTVTSPDSGVTFAWFLNGIELSDSNAVSVRDPGIYIAVTTGPNSCRTTDTVELLEPLHPDVMTRTDTITCVHNARLEAMSDLVGATFLWQDTSGGSVPGALYLTSMAGPVLLTVSGTNGCTHDTTVVIEIDTLRPIAIGQNHQMVLCNLQTINLDASASVGQDLGFLWSSPDGIINSGSTTPNPTITGEGTYIVSITDHMNGCTDSDSILVIEGQSALGVIEFTAISECEGNGNGSILIDSVPGAATAVTFELDGIAGGPLFSGLSSGMYLITAIDSFGCTTDTTVAITNTGSTSSVNLGADVVITLGDSTLLAAEINLDPSQLMSVRWLDQVTCDTCLSNFVRPLHTTTFEIEIEDRFGCIARDAVRVIVEERAKFFIPNIFSPNGDGTNDELTVLTHPGVERVLKFSIFDRWGDVVYHQVDFDGSDRATSWDGRAEGKEVNPGVFVYLLELKLITGRSEIFTGTLTLIK
jgi:gliding motility-associated-like protein